MRRRKLLAVLILVLVAPFALGVIRAHKSPKFTPQHYHRIELGMSRAEVEAILGPPGDYKSRPDVFLARRPDEPTLWDARNDEALPGPSKWPCDSGDR